MKTESQKSTGLGYFLTMWLLRVLTIFVFPLVAFAVFGQQPPVLVSPSHPFVDANGNGIDDFEEDSGIYSDPEEKARVFGITFPIAELGNCAGYSECFTYCEDPINFSQCVDYAKEKGFYKEDELQKATDQFWEDTKDELGCDSADSCLVICRDPANYEKCDAFAKNKGIVGGYIEEPDKPDFLQIAKEVLGCDSAASCANFCDDPANTQKCTDFANQVGLLGGTTTEGPGGCQTSESCLNLCRDPALFQSCVQYAPAGTSFTGPGGCDSATSCRTYCEENYQQCRSYAPGASGHYVPMTCGENAYFGPGGVCTPLEKNQDAENCFQNSRYWNGQNCEEKPPPGISVSSVAYFQPRADMGDCRTPGECYDWCKANPGSCGGFNTDMPRPIDYNPNLYYAPQTEIKYEPKPEMGNCTTPSSCYDWCSQNPGQCGGFNPDSPRPDENYQPPTYYQPPPGSYPSPYPYSGSSPYPGSYNQPYSGSGSYSQPKPNMGGCTTPTSCYDYCAANPGQCSGFNPNAPRPTDTYTPGTYYPPSGSNTAPYSGSETYQQPSSGSYTPPADSGSYTPPSDSGSNTPPSDSGSYTPPSDSGGSGEPSSGVQGTKTAQNLLERILNFLNSLLQR